MLQSRSFSKAYGNMTPILLLCRQCSQVSRKRLCPYLLMLHNLLAWSSKTVNACSQMSPIVLNHCGSMTLSDAQDILSFGACSCYCGDAPQFPNCFLSGASVDSDISRLIQYLVRTVVTQEMLQSWSQEDRQQCFWSFFLQAPPLTCLKALTQ